jgi:hypothetical protein
VSFAFCMDNKQIADQLKREIMLAPDDLLIVIDEKSKRARAHAVHDGDYTPPDVAAPMRAHSFPV